MKSKLKENKGITLIALIVTVIVLLILAAVTLRLILGQNGVIDRTKESKTKATTGSDKEKISLWLSDYQAEHNGSSNIDTSILPTTSVNGTDYPSFTDSYGTVFIIDGDYIYKVEDGNKGAEYLISDFNVTAKTNPVIDTYYCRADGMENKFYYTFSNDNCIITIDENGKKQEDSASYIYNSEENKIIFDGNASSPYFYYEYTENGIIKNKVLIIYGGDSNILSTTTEGFNSITEINGKTYTNSNGDTVSFGKDADNNEIRTCKIGDNSYSAKIHSYSGFNIIIDAARSRSFLYSI